MEDARPGTVFIGEDFDLYQPYLLTGRFTAHWEAEDGREHLDGPEGVSAEEAIAWGRHHADVVLIRLGDSDVHYSAGRLQPPPVPDDDEDFPVWPEGKRVKTRRWPGMEHLDLVTDEPIAWDVRLPRRVSRRHSKRDVERLREVLDADEAVGRLHANLEVGDSRADAIFRFVVRARSHEEAMHLVLEVQQRTLDQLPHPADEIPHDAGGAWVHPTGWNPMDDIRPASPTAREQAGS